MVCSAIHDKYGCTDSKSHIQAIEVEGMIRNAIARSFGVDLLQQHNSNDTDMIQNNRTPTYKGSGHRSASSISMEVTLLPRMTYRKQEP